MKELDGGLPSQGNALWLGEHQMQSSTYGEVEVKLLIARPRENKRLNIYAVPLEEKRSAEKVYDEYEHRFGIDTSYRMIRKA